MRGQIIEKNPSRSALRMGSSTVIRDKARAAITLPGLAFSGHVPFLAGEYFKSLFPI